MTKALFQLFTVRQHDRDWTDHLIRVSAGEDKSNPAASETIGSQLERGSLPCYPRLTCFESCAYSCKRRGSSDFGLGSASLSKNKRKWRATADEDGHYCFAVGL
jgi:hypothetical protein